VDIRAAPTVEEEVAVRMSGVLEVQLLRLEALAGVVVPKVTRFLGRVEQVATEALAQRGWLFCPLTLHTQVCPVAWVVVEVGVLVES